MRQVTLPKLMKNLQGIIPVRIVVNIFYAFIFLNHT